MKKLLVAALALFVLAGCIGQGFDAGHAKFAEIKSRYVSGERFLPENQKELELMQKELSALKESSNDSALVDFLGVELAKLDMQLNFVKARSKLQGINLSRIDCAELQDGLGLLKKAEESGNLALGLVSDFQKQHPAEFLKVDFERDRVSSIVLGIQSNEVYVNNLKQLSC